MEALHVAKKLVNQSPHYVLERAERACLITNSLIAESTLTASVTVAG